jgi:hypothetical protein
VIINVYLPPLTLSLGYAQVQGMWLEQGRLMRLSWKAVKTPPTAWAKVKTPGPRTWKTERP